MTKCKMPGCSNELEPGRTYECSACTTKIMEVFYSLSRPLSDLLGDLEDVAPDSHTDRNQKPDRSGESSTGDDSLGA